MAAAMVVMMVVMVVVMMVTMVELVAVVAVVDDGCQCCRNAVFKGRAPSQAGSRTPGKELQQEALHHLLGRWWGRTEPWVPARSGAQALS